MTSGRLSHCPKTTPTSRRHRCAKPSLSSPLKGEEAKTGRLEQGLGGRHGRVCLGIAKVASTLRLGPCNRVFDQAAGVIGVAEALDFHPLAVFQVLIMLEEVGDLLDHDIW